VINVGKSEYDILIIGSGSAAFAGAIRATELGAKVAIVEKRVVGGVCVNRGCIPSKMLIHAAKIFHEATSNGFTAKEQGWSYFKQRVSEKDALVLALRQKKYLDIAEGNESISMLRGDASFRGDHVVDIGGKSVRADKFLIATGAHSFIPPISGIQGVPYLTSELLSDEKGLKLEELPESLVVIGGAVIGCELGQMFHRFGSKATILQNAPRLLVGIDEEVSAGLCEILQEEGMSVVCNASATRVEATSDGVCVTADVDAEKQKFKSSHL